MRNIRMQTGINTSRTVGNLLLTAVLLLIPKPAHSLTIDSLFEPVFRSCNVLPDYYLRFNLSTFALHRDAFFKRQYLAEPNPDLEFKLISYNNFISSVWDVDFLFGLGEVPGNTVFTVLNVAFGIDPKIEVDVLDHRITGGFAHHCYHEIDEGYFPLIHNNRFHLGVSTTNTRLNDYFRSLFVDSIIPPDERYSWNVEYNYYLRKFFGLVDPGKLNGNSPELGEVVIGARHAFAKRRSWVFTFRGEHTLGLFDKDYGYHVKSGNSLYWKLALGFEAFFTRGTQGGCFFLLYHLDDLPVPDNAPDFTLGNWRFSKNGLLQIGMSFFN